MTNKAFKIFAAFTMLLLYASVFAAGNVVALTCECRHHKADVHTAFDHIHICEHSDVHHLSDCHHDCTTTECGQSIADKSCCSHNHSTSIALYTQPRTADDDSAERQAVLLGVVTDVLNFVEAEQDLQSHTEYGLYLPPSLLAGHTSGCSLRAPPAFV